MSATLHTYSSEFEELVSHLTPYELQELDAILEGIAIPPWLPLPGPQLEALQSPADELFYGGAAGGGKTDLVLGCALTQHWDSIIFRREFQQLKGIRKRATEILSAIGKFNGSDLVWRIVRGEFAGRTIEMGACQFAGDEQKYQGRPHDLKAFDEITHFTEEQYRFLKGWNRTTRRDAVTGKPQRTRVIAAGNPPINAEGQWVNKYWAPWLDPTHPNPAKPGELRWFITNSAGEDEEVPDNSLVTMVIDGVEQEVQPTSRTFIRARIHDNPYLIESGYLATLQALPEPLRSRMLGGNFGVAEDDNEWQVIPTSWILAAQARWAPTYEGYLAKLAQRRLDAINAKAEAPRLSAQPAGTNQGEEVQGRGDISQKTGSNPISLSQSARRRGVAAELPESLRGLTSYNGGSRPAAINEEVLLTPIQRKLNAGNLTTVRGSLRNLPGARDVGVDAARGGRDKTVVSERIGSWFAPLKVIPGTKTPDGPSLIDVLIEMGYEEWRCKIDVVGVGSSPVDVGKLKGMDIIAMSGAEESVATDRSGTLRFANQRAEWMWLFREALDPTLGLEMALPPDPELAADLAAPTWSLNRHGIVIEDKKHIKKRIGRSPDRGDAVINAFAQPHIEGQGFLNYYREQAELAKSQGVELEPPKPQEAKSQQLQGAEAFIAAMRDQALGKH